MAFGKKKTDEPQEAVANLFEEEEVEDAPEDLQTTAGRAEPRAVPDAPPEAAGEPVEAPAEAAADPLAGGADALLSLFQEDEGGSEDRGALLDLAGEVELADLLDDLRTVAVALKIDHAAR